MYISLPSLNDYDGKMPNFKFYEGHKQSTAKFSLFLNLNMILRNSAQKECPCIWQSKRWTSLSNRNRGWKNANSLFKRRFRSCRRRSILNSLLVKSWRGQRNNWVLPASNRSPSRQLFQPSKNVKQSKQKRFIKFIRDRSSLLIDSSSVTSSF